MRERMRRAGWLWLYTAIWLAGAAALVAIMRVSGRSLVWNLDGIKQHYTTLGLVRRTVRDLLAGRGFSMVNFSLGQGLDTLTTCAYYGYTDPVSLLAAFFPERSLESAYNLIALLRMYLAGACFGLYARRVGAKEDWAVAVAGAVYVFSNFFLRMLGRHPFFMNGPLYLPLLLLGVERVLRRRRWLAYTLVTALMLIVNFYFAYMNTVVAVLYILLRLAFRLRQRGVKESARDGFMLLGGYLLGVALAAAVLWPVARLFLSSSRVGVASGYDGSMLFYGMTRVREALAELFAPAWSVGRYLNVGFLPLALPGLVGLCCRRDRSAAQVGIGVALCLVGLCVPLLGKVMNGMAYVEDRWSYVLSLPMALGCALGLPELMKGGQARRWAAAGLSLAWAAGLAVYSAAGNHGAVQPAAPLMMAATAAVPLAGCLGRGRGGRRLSRGLAAVLAAACCVVYMGRAFRPDRNNLIGEQVKSGVYDRILHYTAAPDIEDDGVYRVEQAAYDDAQAALLGYMGTSFYWSLVPDEVSEYYVGLGLPDMRASNRIQTLGGSAPMNAVAGVKYYLQKKGGEYVVPSGFEAAGAERLDSEDWSLYENPLYLPLGYAYDEVMSRAAYDALPLEDRLQAITRYAICDGVGTERTDFESGALTLPSEVKALKNVELDGETLRVSREGRGSIQLTFDAPADMEIYLLAEGVELVKPSAAGPLSLNAEGSGGVAKGSVRGQTNNFYFEHSSLAFCLGSGPMTACTLSLPRKTVLRCESLRVVALPLAGYRESVEARRAEGMTDVALGVNRVSGKIRVSGDRVLQIALPYSEGWRAWVDGAERQVFCCGGMYLGVALEAGKHDVELRYCTPGLKAGLAVSGGALLLTLALLLAGRARRRRRT